MFSTNRFSARQDLYPHLCLLLGCFRCLGFKQARVTLEYDDIMQAGSGGRLTDGQRTDDMLIICK